MIIQLLFTVDNKRMANSLNIGLVNFIPFGHMQCHWLGYVFPITHCINTMFQRCFFQGIVTQASQCRSIVPAYYRRQSTTNAIASSMGAVCGALHGLSAVSYGSGILHLEVYRPPQTPHLIS